MSKSEILLEAGTNELEIIEFVIHEKGAGGEPRVSRFGVNVAKVLEVIESPDLTPLDHAPHPCFMGTIPLRERILPVLDLSVWLGMDRQRQEHEVILVTEFNQTITGFLATDVVQIHRVGWGDVQPPGKYIGNIEAACLTGLVQLEDRFIQLLDLEKIIAEFNPEMIAEAMGGEQLEQAFKALVADDSRTMRAMLRSKLEGGGFEVMEAADGKEAWHKLLGWKEQAKAGDAELADFVDIVVTDIEMPAMDGYTLTKQIKSDAELADLPVIMFSSLITESIRHKGLSVGADDQISKPEFNELAGRARRLVEKAK